MKSIAILLLATTLVQAGFKLPRSVFRMAQIEEATQLAKEKNKGLAFVYTDEKST